MHKETMIVIVSRIAEMDLKPPFSVKEECQGYKKAIETPRGE